MDAPRKRYRVEIGEPKEIGVILVGCGGTGGFAALHLARLAWACREKGIALGLGFIDPDVVEAKNIGRQNFCPAEIGRPKAVTLAQRYGLAFGLRIGAIVDNFQPAQVRHWVNTRKGMTVLVGAVDNVAARRDIAGVAPHRGLWWLDAGNSEHHGQVLIGNGQRVELDATGYATHLPRPNVQEPGLLQSPESRVQSTELSCAELLVQEAQSLMINQMMASWIGVYLTRLILSRDLDVMATHIDLRSGSARSEAIVSGQVSGIAARRAGAAVWTPGATADVAAGVCPECGNEVARGRDIVAGEEQPIVFCPACHWVMLEREFAEEFAA